MSNQTMADPKSQLPDRVDSTICLPYHRIERKNLSVDEKRLRRCFAVAFDRLGSNLSVIHFNEKHILAPIYDFSSKTLSSCCCIDLSREYVPHLLKGIQRGYVRSSWSRDSKRILFTTESNCTFLIDNKHKFGPELAACITVEPTCLDSVLTQDKPSKKTDKNSKTVHHDYGVNDSIEHAKDYTLNISQYINSFKRFSYHSHREFKENKDVNSTFQTAAFFLQDSVVASQIHPSGNGGVFCLNDGRLLLFRFPQDAFRGITETEISFIDRFDLYLYLVSTYQIMSARFDQTGCHLYAASSCGSLLSFDLSTNEHLFVSTTQSEDNTHFNRHPDRTNKIQDYPCIVHVPDRIIKIPDEPIIRQIVISRDNNLIALNATDGVIRLYSIHQVNDTTQNDPLDVINPIQRLQNAVSRRHSCVNDDYLSWVDCDFSFNSEYLISGLNNPDNGGKYEIYFWNVATGVLMEKIVGPAVQLYSISFHPTRPLFAVGTSDGFVDIWGPKIDWKAFAPDFQALERNIEYIEREDEFDIVVDGDSSKVDFMDVKYEEKIIDIVKASDDPAEQCEAFHFDIALCHRNGRKRRYGGEMSLTE